MAVRVVSVTRENPPPCQHFLVVADVDGREVSFRTDPADLLGDDESSIAEEVVKHLRGSRSVDLESLAGKAVVPRDPPVEAPEVSVRTLVSAPAPSLWSRVKEIVWPS